jgi:nucleotide-binding universal stress UspA family protein
MTPVEIDTHLARLWGEADAAFGRADGVRSALKTNALAVERGAIRVFGPEKIARMTAKAEAFEAEGREAAEKAAPYETEFTDRGGWKRYFLVVSSDGHVHRERNCVTCFPRTAYHWIVELADCDEAAMVLKYGEKACTICFPNAPAMKGWGEYKDPAKEARKAERAAKAAAKEAAMVHVPEFNEWGAKTFKTERGAEIEAVHLFCLAVERDAYAVDSKFPRPHCRELAIEDRAKAWAICAALGEKRGLSEEAVEMALDKRVVAKRKRDRRG